MATGAHCRRTTAQRNDHSDDHTAWTVAPQPACSALGLLSTSATSQAVIRTHSTTRPDPGCCSGAFAKITPWRNVPRPLLSLPTATEQSIHRLLPVDPTLPYPTTLSATINRLLWYFHLELYIGASRRIPVHCFSFDVATSVPAARLTQV